MLRGRIIKNISDSYTVLVDNQEYICKARGKFRRDGLTPLVGDIVDFQEEDNYILKIEPRVNELKRPHISNVDIALIVTSLKKPDLALNLLDKEIASVVLENIIPVICFTKLDLASDDVLEKVNGLRKYYEGIGIKVFTNREIDDLVSYLKDKYVVLTGQTGAGKSSLLNKLDANLNLETNEISEALGRGKHTTRHTEFHYVKGIFFADTPGFSALDLKFYSKEEIRDAFLEFRDANCEFRDCMHDKERKCEIKDKVKMGDILRSRYDNYISFIK